MKILLLADGSGTELQIYKSANDTNVTVQLENEDQSEFITYDLAQEDLTELIDELLRLRREIYGD